MTRESRFDPVRLSLLNSQIRKKVKLVVAEQVIQLIQFNGFRILPVGPNPAVVINNADVLHRIRLGVQCMINRLEHRTADTEIHSGGGSRGVTLNALAEKKCCSLRITQSCAFLALGLICKTKAFIVCVGRRRNI